MITTKTNRLIRAGLVPLLALSLTAASTPITEWNGIHAISPGMEVRIERTGGITLTGKFQSVTDDAIVVDNGQSWNLTRQEVKRVLVKTDSQRKAHALAGLGIGAGAGAAIGFGAVQSAKPSAFVLSPGQQKAIATGFGAVVGGLLGAITGALLPTGWETVYRR